MLTHSQAIMALTPSDYRIIEREHKLLEQYLNNLRDACVCSNLDSLPNCQSCDKEKQISCLGRLPSFLFHIIELAGRHFDDEETIMLRRPHVTKDYEYYRNHKQAHISIMQKLQSLVDNCLNLAMRDHDGVADIYIQFHNTLLDLFEEHDRLFDDPFIESTKTQVS